MNDKDILDKVLSMLGRQKFADWYNNGNFANWIECNPGRDNKIPSREQVLADLKQMLGL